MRLIAATCLLLGLVAPLARAETVRTKDGQRLVGEVVDESGAELVLRTRWGVLVIPRASIEAVEGRPGAAAAPAQPSPPGRPEAPVEAGPDPARVQALRLRARRQAQTGQAAAALAALDELLALDPDDGPAHAERCALLAQAGQAAEAVAALRRALLAGFTDLEALRRDPRLAKLADDPALGRLLEQRAGLAKLAARRAPARLAKALRARGATAALREARDEARGLTWLHALDDAAFARVRGEVEAFVDAARRDPLAAPGAPEPLFVVLLPEQDRAVAGPAGTSWDAPTSVLTLGPLPAGSLARAPSAQRELSRALVALDAQARRRAPAPWLEEGLVELLGTAAVTSEAGAARLVPRTSPHVDAARKALAALPASLAGGAPATPPFGGLAGITRAELERRGRAGRVGLRSLLAWLWSEGALSRLHERHGKDEAAEAGAAARAVEAALEQAALGQDGAEKRWQAWLAAQVAPPAPFTGVVTGARAQGGGLRVTYVLPESGGAAAGIAEGDLLVAADGARLESEDDLTEVLGARAVGQQVELLLLKGGDEPARVAVTLQARPPGRIGPQRDEAPYLGLAVEALEAGGVKVGAVDAGSPAAKSGLAPGDRLVSLDGQEVGTVRAWLRAIRQKQAGQKAALVIERAGQRRTLEVDLVPLPR